jgi:hypothetical protein
MNSSEINCTAREHGSRFAVRGPFGRSLRSAASAALVGLALLAASTSALAGIPGLGVTVTALVPPINGVRTVSYNDVGTAYQAAYELRITNSNTTVNTIYFGALTTLSDGRSAPFGAPLGLRQGDSCTGVGGTTLNCTFGSIPRGGELVVTLLVPSPTAPSPVQNTALGISWDVQAGQGQLNPSNFVHEGSQDVILQVGSAKDGVQSFVLEGTPLYVIDAGAAGAKTAVTPSKAVTVGVKQIVPGSSCSPQNKKCFESTVTIVDDSGQEVPFTQDNPLQIDLFRPVDTLKKGARFANATLYYQSGSGAWVQIQTCEVSTVTPAPAQPYLIPTSYPYRCITPQKLPYAATGETGVDVQGNWYFHILGLFNGIIHW